jgi:catechol 2,3-dioxygenase-like lactoylglutathione lyase family enzyme
MAATVQVVIDCADPARLAEFWAEALGYRLESPPEGFDTWPDFLRSVNVPESEWGSASAVVDPDGPGPRLFFQRVPEPKTGKNRIHLDIRAAPGFQGDERMATLEAECDRLVKLGATRVRRHEPAPQMSAGFIVMTDPEGNEFCLD